MGADAAPLDQPRAEQPARCEREAWALLVKGSGWSWSRGEGAAALSPWRGRTGEPARSEDTQRGSGVTDGRSSAAIGVLRWRPS